MNARARVQIDPTAKQIGRDCVRSPELVASKTQSAVHVINRTALFFAQKQRKTSLIRDRRAVQIKRARHAVLIRPRSD
jgi:hypothetical protein